jgi:protocatechuate 3,4-dioxygenase beta subunit
LLLSYRSYKLRPEIQMRVLRGVLGALAVWANAFVSLSYSQTPAAAKETKEKEETCRISGMVVKLADSAPLKGATVRLENGEDREHTIAMKTMANGRFELKNIPAGRYKLIVTRNGYVNQEYGQRRPSDPGAVFALSPGQAKTDILFKLIPSAVIAGRVFDEDGEPVVGAIVGASREMYREGHKTIVSVNQVATDDLGAFRLFGLPPGKYFVSASEQWWGRVEGDPEFSESSGKGADRGYAKTYYPGTVDVSRAGVINVKEGDEISGTDISLKQVAVYRVRGRVLNQLTSKPGQDVMVLLMPRTKRREWDFGGEEQVKKADGSFEIKNVVPGAYTIVAFWNDPSEGKNHTAMQKLDVGESDIEGVLLTLGGEVQVQGRVVWDGKPSLERHALMIGAYPVDGPFHMVGAGRVGAKQQFTMKDLMEGDLRIEVGGATKDCYVKQIIYGQNFVKDDVISVSKGTNPALEITMSSRGAGVQGAVTDKDGLPAAGVWVVAVPDGAHREQERWYKAQTTDQYGKFELRGLAPGSYKLFSWTGVEEHEWEDQDFLRSFEDKGESLELQDEDRKTIILKVMEKSIARAE